MKQVNKNFLYNIVYQIFVFAIPLLTIPYVSRVLGVNNVGIYSYTYSIVFYFMLCSLIGINNFGSRNIAKNRDINDRSILFSNLIFLQILLSLVMLVLYYIFVFFIYRYNTVIMMLQSLFLISAMFDINWFYFGIEKFKITISRNIIIKVLSLLLVFWVVKSRGDLWKYTLIMSGSTLISQIYLWIFLRKYVLFKKPTFKGVIENLKPCLILFIPVIAYSIYRVMDKTMIGYFSNTVQLGNYESAEKIINIPISIITALGTVMLPYMSRSDSSGFQQKIMDTFRLSFFMIVPICFGLFVISDDFCAIFFGSEFSLTSNIIKLLLITVVFSSISNVIRTSYLIPKEFDYIYVNSTILGAVVNLIFNLLFIKKYGAYGACIGTIAAEFFVMSYQVFKTKEKIDYVRMLKILCGYLFKSLIFAVLIILVGKFIENLFEKIIIQIVFSVLIYIILNYKYIYYDFLGRGHR